MTRSKRIKKFWEQVEDERSKKYFDFIEKQQNKLDWTGVSQNPNITMKDIVDHPDKPWD